MRRMYAHLSSGHRRMWGCTSQHRSSCGRKHCAAGTKSYTTGGNARGRRGSPLGTVHVVSEVAVGFCRDQRDGCGEISASSKCRKLSVRAILSRICGATASLTPFNAQLTEEWRCDLLNSISCSSPDDWDMLQRRLQRAAAHTSARQEATQAAMAAVEVRRGWPLSNAAMRAACTYGGDAASLLQSCRHVIWLQLKASMASKRQRRRQQRADGVSPSERYQQCEGEALRVLQVA